MNSADAHANAFHSLRGLAEVRSADSVEQGNRMKDFAHEVRSLYTTRNTMKFRAGPQSHGPPWTQYYREQHGLTTIPIKV